MRRIKTKLSGRDRAVARWIPSVNYESVILEIIYNGGESICMLIAPRPFPTTSRRYGMPIINGPFSTIFPPAQSTGRSPGIKTKGRISPLATPIRRR